jgi:hypothetical protein
MYIPTRRSHQHANSNPDIKMQNENTLNQQFSAKSIHLSHVNEPP